MRQYIISGIAFILSSFSPLYAQQDAFFSRPEKFIIEHASKMSPNSPNVDVFIRAAQSERDQENYMGAYRQYKNAHGTVPPVISQELADKFLEKYHLDAVHARQLRWVVERYREAYHNTIPQEKKIALATILAVSNSWFDPDEENCTQTTTFNVNEKLKRIGLEQLTEDETRTVIRSAVKLYDKGKQNHAGKDQYLSPAEVVEHLNGRALPLPEGLESFVFDIFFGLGKPVHDILSSFSDKQKEWPNEWIKSRYNRIVADLLETPYYTNIKKVCEIANHQVPLVILEEYAYKLWNAEFYETAASVLSDIKARDAEYIFDGVLKSTLVNTLSNQRAPIREIIHANAAVGLSLKDYPSYKNKLVERAMASIHDVTISRSILAAQRGYHLNFGRSDTNHDQSDYMVNNAVRQIRPWLDDATTVSSYLKDQRIPIAREMFKQICSLGKEEPPLGSWTFERVLGKKLEIMEAIADSYINAGDKKGCSTLGLLLLESGRAELSLPFLEKAGHEQAAQIARLRATPHILKTMKMMRIIYEYVH